MDNNRTRAVQALGAVGLITLGTRSVLLSLDQWGLKPVIWNLQWPLIAQGLAATVVSYLILIWSTGEIIRGWEFPLSGRTVFRLWFRSNLARYVPRYRGLPYRLIAIAEQERLPAKYVAGSALHPPLVWLGTGGAVAAVLLAFYRYGNTKINLPVLLLGALVVLVMVFGLSGTDLPRKIGLMLRRPETVKPADAESLGIAILANIIAWGVAGYGATLIGQGLLVGFRIDWMLMTAAVAGGVVAGYVFLLLPTGLLVREAVIYALIKREVGYGPALAMALSYRGIVTAIEIVASSFLLLRRPSRDVT